MVTAWDLKGRQLFGIPRAAVTMLDVLAYVVRWFSGPPRPASP